MPLSANSRGALMMTIAMGAFTTNDALIKSITHDLNIAQIIFLRGIATAIILAVMAWSYGILGQFRLMFNKAVILRSGFEIGATITYISALSHIDLSVAATILLSLPLAVTFGAWAFFKEPVGWRRWLAIIVGFVGVIIILKPSPEAFVPASLLAVITVFFTAGRDLTTRRINSAIPTLLVSLFAGLTNTVFGAVLIVPMGGWMPVSGHSVLIIVVAACFIIAGYLSIISAMRTGDISFIAPFRYTSLIFSLSLGYYLFQERPDGYMTLGASLIVASGLYAFYREKQRTRETPAAKSTQTPN
ncbi:DMT family transporter [Rhizobium lemnae]|uniref:DMT family transporter n=1 Tax=Rhizobium lemnae TaxID=1214924 RepID=A0ABV8EBD7_9HYPH|nr:DMT family transporter [Rhizobium lemnae]MCJ8506839.1 DMT family transporter [Rhizobium lemnae]